MCTVSMVTDHFDRQWPRRFTDPSPYEPMVPAQPWPQPIVPLSPCSWDEYLVLKRKAEEYDRLTGQPDCFDPKKQEFEEAVKTLLREKYGMEPKESVPVPEDFAAKVREHPEAALAEIMAALGGPPA